MYNFGYETGPGHHHETSAPPPRGRPSLLRMIFAAFLIVTVASLLFGSGFWAVGLLFDLIGFVFKVAILIAVSTFIWHRVVRGRVRDRRI